MGDSNSKLAVSKLVGDGSVILSTADGAPPAKSGSVHLLIEPVGPLSAGNDFNWWNLVIIKPGKSVSLDARQGQYAIYLAQGDGEIRYVSSIKAVDGKRVVYPQPLSATGRKGYPREHKKPGYFTIEIVNVTGPARSGGDAVPALLEPVALPPEDLVASVLLAVDPGTTPVQGGPRPVVH